MTTKEHSEIIELESLKITALAVERALVERPDLVKVNRWTAIANAAEIVVVINQELQRRTKDASLKKYCDTLDKFPPAL